MDTIACLLDSEELDCLDWFFHRSWIKLPGLFLPGFWSTLLAQAVRQEQAVLHAVIALGTVHRADAYQGRYRGPGTRRSILSSYCKAIHYLQPHFNSETWASARIILITCLVFVTMEYLQGNVQQGHLHLNNGLRLLQGKSEDSKMRRHTHLRHAGDDSADSWLVEIFFRFQVSR